MLTDLLAMLALLAAISGPPRFAGDMTWYAETGSLTRAALPYSEGVPSFAVDTALWPSYTCGPRVGPCARILVCGPVGCAVGPVLDTGYLARAGVVLDASPAAFRATCGELEIGRCEVRGWVMP